MTRRKQQPAADTAKLGVTKQTGQISDLCPVIKI